MYLYLNWNHFLFSGQKKLFHIKYHKLWILYIIKLNLAKNKLILSMVIGTLNLDKTTAHSISVTFEHSLKCSLVSIFTLQTVQNWVSFSVSFDK